MKLSKTTCYIVKSTVICAIIFLAAPHIVAQESVEETTFKDDYSIIREINENESLIYNCYQGHSSFTLTKEGTSLIEYISQSYMYSYVRDFEILNGEDVYFCAERYDMDATNKNVLRDVFIGHFTMTDFRAASWYTTNFQVDVISLSSIIGVTRTNKLDVYKDVVGALHVIVTGSINTMNCIVEAYLYGRTWTLNYTPTTNQNEVYDDVAITNKYVAVSSHNENNSTGNILLFNKPSGANSIFPNPSVGFTRIVLPYSVNGEVLLEWCKDDTLVSACHSAYDNAVYLSGYNGSFHIATIGMPLQSNLSPDSQLKDLSYNSEKRSLEVLQYELIVGDTASVVYHITPVVLNAPTTLIFGNYYKCETLNSIVNKKYLAGLTFASGHSYDNCYNAQYNNYKVLRKYVLLQGFYGNCTSSKKMTVWLDEKTPSVSGDTFSTMEYHVQLNQWLWEKGGSLVDIICH